MISGRAPLPGLFDSRSTFACLPPREFTPAQPPAALQQQEARRSAHPHREPKRHPSTPRFPAHVRSLQEPPRHALDTPWQQSAIIQNRNLLRWQIERTGRLEGRSGTLTGRTGIFSLFRGGGLTCPEMAICFGTLPDGSLSSRAGVEHLSWARRTMSKCSGLLGSQSQCDLNPPRLQFPPACGFTAQLLVNIQLNLLNGSFQASRRLPAYFGNHGNQNL